MLSGLNVLLRLTVPSAPIVLNAPKEGDEAGSLSEGTVQEANVRNEPSDQSVASGPNVPVGRLPKDAVDAPLKNPEGNGVAWKDGGRPLNQKSGPCVVPLHHAVMSRRMSSGRELTILITRMRPGKKNPPCRVCQRLLMTS